MKNFFRTLLASTFLIFSAGGLFANSEYSFGITPEAKKISADAQQKKGVNLSREAWVYSVTIENKSFKDVQNIEIKYILFEKPQNASETGNVRHDSVRIQGINKVSLLKNFEKYTFATEPIQRTHIQLKPGYIWKSGSGKRESKDRMSGLWIRIFVNGLQVEEFMDPPSLGSQEKWDSK